MAIRTALGASRSQLIRQLLIESLVLATAGGLAGALLGLWGNDFARQLIPWEMQSLAVSSGGLDLRVLFFIAVQRWSPASDSVSRLPAAVPRESQRRAQEHAPDRAHVVWPDSPR